MEMRRGKALKVRVREEGKGRVERRRRRGGKGEEDREKEGKNSAATVGHWRRQHRAGEENGRGKKAGCDGGGRKREEKGRKDSGQQPNTPFAKAATLTK